MCGIAGYIGRYELSPERTQQALRLMQNRGPDHRAEIHERVGKLHVHLLHSRLSIIDLDARSHQPFSFGPYTLVYNGELYNYVEIRRQLRDAGHEFITDSDTEVLLHAYQEWGDACFDRFEGMWAFALFDRAAGTLLLSRDRFAEKPLYVLETGDGWYFASETRFLRAMLGRPLEVNERYLLRYMVNGYKSLYKSDELCYRGVREVPYASNLKIGADLKGVVTPYWVPRYSPRQMTSEQAIEGIRERLQKSLEIRLRSDVPLAFCLSGGIDSSSLVSLAVKKFGCDVATYSIVDPDERYNEEDLIDATVADLGCRNVKIRLEKAADLTRLRELIGYHDTPIATISYYIHSMLSQAISRDGFKVAISGTAADELFTGYYDHFNLHLYEVRNSPDYAEHLQHWRNGIGKVVRNPYLSDPELYAKNPAMRDHIYLGSDEFASFLRRDFSEPFVEQKMSDSLLRNRMLNEMFYEATRVIVHEDDLNSMLYSVENRSPYLDRDLFEFAYQIPSELLIQKGYGKYLLRESVKGILNDRVRLETQKKGFNASILSVVDFDNAKCREELLGDSPVFDIVRKNKVEELMRRPTLPNSASKFLFNFINVKFFLEQAR